jgi:hypothetical protein
MTSDARRLERPQKPDQLDMWVDEDIWGHRLYDEQTPWMTFLEFLGILQSEFRDNRAFQESEPNQLRYKAYWRLYLRNILFNNPRLEAILEEFPNDDRARWAHWLEHIRKDSGGVPSPDFSYLRDRFHSFEHFASVVRFFKASAIEGDSNKRWSSKFVFPYGPHCLYEDLKVSPSGSASTDRRFFGRTGELLYLMLCRSGRGHELLHNLKPLISQEDPRYKHLGQFDRIAAAFQREDDLIKTRTSGSPPFLPYASLPEYENLADDWLGLFGCGMPVYDVLPHIVTITGLHLIIYLLTMAQRQMALDEKPQFILEIISPRKTVIRDLSRNCFQQNNLLPEQAVRKRIQSVTESSEWMACFGSADPLGVAVKVLLAHFAWDDAGEVNCHSPNDLLEHLLERAEARHKQHLGNCHGTWSRETGLASSRGTNRTRYAPTDSLLKTLVFATVPGRMEFKEFLSELRRKYGFIIGDAQAEVIIASGEADREAFVENSVRLEQRLASMGLLTRLSDACAYVSTPFGVEQER